MIGIGVLETGVPSDGYASISMAVGEICGSKGYPLSSSGSGTSVGPG